MINGPIQYVNRDLMFIILIFEKKVTFHTRAKVVGIMRQNACLLAFCVQNLL
jgi:hypothetical protein